MTSRLLIALALVACCGGLAFADPVADGNAGLKALNEGDNEAAIRLFTRVLQSAALAASDRELAYVRRAQAELATGNRTAAVADANAALALDPDDAEAAHARDKAMGLISGPSLADTMNFVVKMLMQQGDVNFVTFNHNTKNAEDATNTFRIRLTHLSSDPDRCTLYYHYTETRDETTTSDDDSGIPLKLVNSIEVMSVVEAKNRAAAMAGTPNIVVSQSSPEAYLVDAIRTDGSANSLYFYDQDTASRVAKALTHAMELCGGGGKDVF